MNTKTQSIVTNALLLAVLVVSSYMSIPIQPVPITLQTLVVMLIGIYRKPKDSFFIILGYIILNFIGLTSSSSAGFQIALSPSFGFILGWLLAAPLQSLYLDRQREVGLSKILLSCFISFIVTYLVGIPYMAGILNLYMGQNLSIIGILQAGLIPFIPGDLIKIFVACLIAMRTYSRFRQQ